MTFESFVQSVGFDADCLSDAAREDLLDRFEADRKSRIESRITSYSAANPDAAARIEAAGQSALAGGKTVNQAEYDLLAADRGSGPRRTFPVQGNSLSAAAVSEVSLLRQIGMTEAECAKHYPAQVIDAATSPVHRNIGFHGLIRNTLATAGHPVPPGRIGDSSIRKAFEVDRALQASSSGPSTYSITNVISAVVNKSSLSAFQAVPAVWSKFCRQSSLPDFKQGSSIRLTTIGRLTEVPAGGEIKHVSMSDSVATNTLKQYAAIVGIDRKDLINDDTSVLANVPASLGRAGAISLERAVFTLLLANTGSFFHSNNSNLKTGAGSALADAGLSDAYQAFLQFVDSNSDPVMVEPKIVLCSPAKWKAARALLDSTLVTGATTANSLLPSGNPWGNKFELVTSPWLAESTGLSGADNDAWWLLTGPGDFAIIDVAFLNGKSAPVVESSELDFNQLGIAHRVYWDFGCGFLEPKGGIQNDGD